MLKAVALAFVSPFLASQAPAQSQPYDPLFIDHPAISQIQCGDSLGTAFRVNPTTYVTAQHVVADGNCSIDGIPVPVTYEDKKLDYATLGVTWDGPALQIDCGGIRDWKPYGGSGFAAGLPYNRVVVVWGASLWKVRVAWDDFDTLEGPERFIPGQSGGPVIDLDTAKVVGIVKGLHRFEPVSYARALKDTPLCQTPSIS